MQNLIIGVLQLLIVKMEQIIQGQYLVHVYSFALSQSDVT